MSVAPRRDDDPPEPSGGRPAGPVRRGRSRLWARLTGPDGPVGQAHAALSYYALLISTLFLLTFGLIMVFSVQSVTIAAGGGSAFTAFLRYLVIAGVGLAAMVATSRIDRVWLQRLAVPALLLAVVLQSLVLVPSLATCAGGNCNWVRLPVVGQAQPSEFIKLALALYIGWVAARHKERLRGGWSVVLFVFAPAGAAIGLVMRGGDLGTVVILALLMAGALWMGGLGKTWFVGLFAAGLVAFGGATMLSANRRARIMAWLHPEAADPLDVGYQPLHGRYALGTGGWAGVGPGSSRQKWGYLTQADSDYVFAVLGEEFGLVGTILVIGLFAVVGWCCLRIMRRSQDLYVGVVTGGIMCWIIGQALVNIGVVVGILPVLGVPLPLISAGGSSLVFVLIAVGVLLSFARHEPGAERAFATHGGAVRRTLAVISTRRRNRA